MYQGCITSSIDRKEYCDHIVNTHHR